MSKDPGTLRLQQELQRLFEQIQGPSPENERRQCLACGSNIPDNHIVACPLSGCVPADWVTTCIQRARQQLGHR